MSRRNEKEDLFVVQSNSGREHGLSKDEADFIWMDKKQCFFPPSPFIFSLIILFAHLYFCSYLPRKEGIRTGGVTAWEIEKKYRSVTDY